jgi:hypothetical protein
MVCLAQLSTVQFAQGDPHEAVAVANTCLDTLRTVHSRRVTDHLTTLRDATTRHRDLSAVAALRHRLNLALAG